MDIEIEVFKMDHGWVYRVGNVYQEYHPDFAGFVPMTEPEARELAQVIYNRIRVNNG